MNKFYVATKGIVLNQHNQILIIQRAKGGRHENMWEFPGGLVEFGELPEESLAREIKEEVNLDIDILRYIYSWKWIENNEQVVGMSFLCRCKDDKKLKLSFEHSNCKWVNISDILDSELDGDIKSNLRKVMDVLLQFNINNIIKESL